MGKDLSKVNGRCVIVVYRSRAEKLIALYIRQERRRNAPFVSFRLFRHCQTNSDKMHRQWWASVQHDGRDLPKNRIKYGLAPDVFP